jgi:crotonobetainyl-CoA:carnitine CoA-transferase CaiB-like acyl-CoA transferase
MAGQGPTSPTVIELGDGVATAFCAMLLQGVGANVTKVSMPGDQSTSRRAPILQVGGDAAPSAVGIYLDLNKRHVELDWTSTTGRDVLARMVSRADVLLTPVPEPPTPEPAGVDSQWLRSVRPSLIVGRVSMFGEDGRYAQLRGTGLQAAALSGLMRMIGEPGRPPLRLPGLNPEYTAGVSLFTGVAFALFQAARSGEGCVVTTSVVRSLAYVDWKSFSFDVAGGHQLTRGSDRGPLVLEAADGFVGFYYRPEEWAAVKRVLGVPELDDEKFATQQSRDVHREQLRTAMERASSKLSARELYHRSQAAGLPVGAVLSVTELLSDPQYRARDFLQRVDVPGVGEVLAPAVPWLVNGRRPVAAGPGPGPGPGAHRPDGLRVGRSS